MKRTFLFVLLASTIAFISASQAVGPQVCKPTLGFKEVRFSPVEPSTMERKWTAVMSVDASRCATTSGRFGILFTRQKENGPEVDFEEKFTWRPTSFEVSVDFWADEAVEEYWLNNIVACPCRD